MNFIPKIEKVLSVYGYAYINKENFLKDVKQHK